MSPSITNEQLLVPRVLWGAFCVSQISFALAGWSATREPLAASGDPSVAWVLVGLGVLVSLSSPLVAKIVARGEAEVPQGEATSAMARAFAPFLIRLGLAESGAVFAVTVLFLQGDWGLWSIPAGVSFAMVLIAFPTAASLEALASAGSKSGGR